MQDELKKTGYVDTLCLPKTDFPLRTNASETDVAMLQRWNEEKLSEKTFTHNHGKEKFILHDGPPYANGNIHLGHAYNKILKDIVTKSERMSGKHVPVIPGWDCHGLPIELKVTQELSNLSRESLKQACRTYAQKWIDIQREEFKKLGVMMHWDRPYTTMDFSYEAKIVRAFGKFFEQGFIQKQLKTVPWCASCQTVLANAEIEYAERKDPSVYVQFPLSDNLTKQLFPEASDRRVSLLIWTTTPWTLPLNRAVVLHPGAQYALVEMNEKLLILGKDVVAKISAIVGFPARVLKTFVAETIIGQRVHHPFIDTLTVPVIGDGYVSLEDGTACVHSAPGCGPDDYGIGVKNKLEIYSPISSDGKYTSEILPAELSGMPIVDGQFWVIKKLAELDRLLFKQSIRHSYPHCWRCRNGLIFRATSQWFCDLSQHNLKNRALEAIQNLTMYPSTGKNRFSSTLEGRLEWCLSRQRTWGVPIPAVHCLDCAHVFTNLELIETAARGIEREGIEFWDRVSIDQLGSLSCSSCSSTNLGKEFDILDVWFESGVSNYAVLDENPDQAFPADMYLEGKDQHRAWFQSSLLTALVLKNSAPMREILTHGFTVDEHGKKMSKSLGNVVTPQQIVDQVGTDGLRLWVSSNDCESDPVVSANLLKNVSEVYRKVRISCRFLLSNLYDFDSQNDSVAVDHMFAIDQQALIKLHEFNEQMMASYKKRDLSAAFHLLANYCSKDLSSFYFDIVKDRLYVERADGLARRSAQTVCSQILHVLTTSMAPILSFTAEQVFDFYKKPNQGSIHLQDFVSMQASRDAVLQRWESISSVKSHVNPHVYFGVNTQMITDSIQPISSNDYAVLWDNLVDIRNQVLKALEKIREQGVIKHSLDAQVALVFTEGFIESPLIFAFFADLGNQTSLEFLKEFFIVSQVHVFDAPESWMTESLPGLFVGVSKADGSKCLRCWQWHSEQLREGLCPRCVDVLKI